MRIREARDTNTMVNAKSGVPRGYQAVMPYLRVRDAASAIKFYKKVFGAAERYRLRMGGKVGHAELDLGGSTVMLSDEFPEVKAVGPKALKGTSVVLTVYVENVDQVVAKAVKAGAKVRRPAADQFYGDRSAQIEDPFGHVWSVQSRIEKVSPQDMQKRLNAMLKAEASATVARRTAGRGTKGTRGRKAATGRRPALARKAARKSAATKAAAPRKTRAVKSSGGRKNAVKRAMPAAKARGRKPSRVGRPRKAAKA
jgi:PhnB protein